jgi:hypothetical protein
MSTEIKKYSKQMFTTILTHLDNIEHVKSRNMTYVEHLYHALYLSKESLIASLYLFVHAFFPVVFQSNGSVIINNLSSSIKDKRN